MTDGQRVSIVAVARRFDVRVYDVYRAILDGDLSAQVPAGGGGTFTISPVDAEQWAGSLAGGTGGP